MNNAVDRVSLWEMVFQYALVIPPHTGSAAVGNTVFSLQVWTVRETVESVTLLGSLLCTAVYRLLCGGYQRRVEGSFQSDYSARAVLRVFVPTAAAIAALGSLWSASDQPEPCLQRAGAAFSPILCSKVKQTSPRSALWCALQLHSHISGDCTSPGQRQEQGRRKERRKEQKEQS